MAHVIDTLVGLGLVLAALALLSFVAGDSLTLLQSVY
jgi:hypothetical protein